MMNHQVAVWLDHQEARIFHVDETSFAKEQVLSTHPHQKLHRKTGPGADSGRRVKEDHTYYEEVAKAIAEGSQILIVGPASAKLELVKYLTRHHHDVADRVLGVETVDHPSDGQLVAYARKYFLEAES